MNLARFAVTRPVFTAMIALIVVVLGATSLIKLRIDLLPAIERPNLSVRTIYPGADPEVVERRVTQIVEEIINTVPGVVELSSTSTEGRSNINVTFGWGTDVDSAASDVRARLEEELSELPDEVERPQIRKFDTASFPVVLLGVSSDELDPVELNDMVERQVRDRFARIPGVAQVDLWGGYNREIRIALQADRIRALGLPLQSIVSAIRNANIDLPAGEIEDGRLEVVLRAPAEYQNLDQLRSLVLDVRNGAAIKLDQVATVSDTYEKLDRLVRVNGKLGIRVAIRKQAEANTVEVAKGILEEIEATNSALPQITVTAVLNQGNFIERSIANVIQSVLLGGALAVIILLFFLRSVRSTIVIASAIPLAILATLTLVYSAGLTLNLMTLGGLALGVGMMVDSAIVVLENIYRRRDEIGDGARDAAVNGAREVTGAIIASTITTLVIFFPLVFVAGVSGLLFRELAFVVVLALITSLIVAITLVPMLAARLVSKRDISNPNPLMAVAARGQAAIEKTYGEVLGWVLHHRLLTIAGCALALAGSLLLYPMLGNEFMPPSDEGQVRIDGEFEPGMRLDIADAETKRLENIIVETVPEITSMSTTVTASGRHGGATARARVYINVGPSTQRTRSNSDIANALKAAIAGQIPGLKVRVKAPQGQFLLDRLLGSESGLDVEIRGNDLATLSSLAEQVAAIAESIDGVSEVDDDREDQTPQQHLTIDRAKVADVGLDVRTVAETLETAIAGRRAGDYRPDGYSIPIKVHLANVEQLSIEEILDQTLRTPTGAQVALRNIVTTIPGLGPSEIQRQNQQRAITVSVDVRDRDEGSVAAELQRKIAAIPRPNNYHMEVAGTYEEQQKASRELTLGFVLALILVYMVLACQYESLRDPLVVMFSVPVAAIGVIVTLYITRSTMNVQSGIGCIMLGGIVVNNAILLVDQARRLRADGSALTDAVAEAGRRRLRPILMTTATTILGLLPLALGVGEGAEAQAPLARAVVGGLLASTIITLVLVPAIYHLVHNDQRGKSA